MIAVDMGASLRACRPHWGFCRHGGWQYLHAMCCAHYLGDSEQVFYLLYLLTTLLASRLILHFLLVNDHVDVFRLDAVGTTVLLHDELRQQLLYISLDVYLFPQ